MHIILKIKEHRLFTIYLVILFSIISFSTIYNYYNFNMYAFDYGIESNVLYNTANGNWFKSGYETDNYLGDHFSPIILFFLPLYWILYYFTTGYTAIVIQTIAFLIGLIGVYCIALNRFSNKLISLLITIVCSTYSPALAFVHYQYHPVALAFPFIIWGIYFLFEKNCLKLAIILLLIAALGKEDIGISIAFIIGFYAITTKQIKLLIPAILACLHSYLAVKMYIPYFRSGTQDSAFKYSHLTLNYILDFKTMLKDTIFSMAKFKYFFVLFQPFLYLPFLSKSIFILIPSFFINYLTKQGDNLHSGLYHYDVVTSAIIMYLFIDALDCVTRFIAKKNHSDNPILILKIIITFIILAGTNSVIQGKLGFSFFSKFNALQNGSNKLYLYKDLQDIKSRIKLTDKILFDANIGGYMAEYTNSRCYTNICLEDKPFNTADYEYVLFLKENTKINQYPLIIQNIDSNFSPYYNNSSMILYKNNQN